MPFDPSFLERVIRQAHTWAEESQAYRNPRAARLLADALHHEGGLDYTVSFVDGVIRPEDPAVSARNLGTLARADASFLPPFLALPARVGGRAAHLAPEIAKASAAKVFAQLVGDLVVDVTPEKVGDAIARLREDGSRLNLNLLGEAVLGHEEAARRMDATRALIEREDVDYVSLKVSAVLGPHAPFGYDHAVEQAVKEMLPLYRLARDTGTFINLDMEEYKDLNLTIDVFKEILGREEFLGYRGGIVLQAYLPDARDRLRDLTQWARKRREAGGAPIKVRIVKGANLSMELVDAIMHGWPLTVHDSKMATDANYLAVLDEALRPENVDAVNIGAAGMNLFTIAFAYLCAKERGLVIGEGVDIEMLAGMASPQSKAVAATVGPLLYYVPVVHPDEYDVAVAYLVRRLEENSSPENFMSNVFDLDQASVRSLEEERFRAAAAYVDELSYAPRRTQDRSKIHELGEEFENTPDTDPSLSANIEWARQIASRVPTSTVGSDIADAYHVAGSEDLLSRLDATRSAQREWGKLSGRERARYLHAVAQNLEDARGELIEVAASEAGKTIDQADTEVSEAIDFARYYAQQAAELDQLEGARFVPHGLTAVIPPWNFPIAIPAGGVLAALAAGSGVAFKPAYLTRRTGARVAQAFWDAGISDELVSLVDFDPDSTSLGRELVEAADQVILTGSYETAALFKSWKPGLRLFAETSGKNAIIVTPDADIDLAVKDVVASAFGHAGQKCSAASLVILVGSMGFSQRFCRQLLDATRSLKVGYPHDLSTQMGPLIEEPHGKLLRGLTTLEHGQGWMLKPRKLAEGLWTPGIRAGVMPGSEYHLTEYFGPILGVMRASNLEEAITWQNATAYGLTAGLHSLNPQEIELWLDTVEAGNLYVNRSITGAIVRRQPFGGWKRSAVGPGTKAGGPNYVLSLGGYEPDFPAEVSRRHIVSNVLRQARSVALNLTTVDSLHFSAAVASMDSAIQSTFLATDDPSDLSVERNVLRYVPAEGVVIRLASGGNVGELFAVAAGALALGVGVEVSSGVVIPRLMRDFLADNGIDVIEEDDATFKASFAGGEEGGRIRLLGAQAASIADALSADWAIYDQPFTACGRIELLPFVREQAVSMTNHRFGNPTHILDGILADSED